MFPSKSWQCTLHLLLCFLSVLFLWRQSHAQSHLSEITKPRCVPSKYFFPVSWPFWGNLPLWSQAIAPSTVPWASSVSVLTCAFPLAGPRAGVSGQAHLHTLPLSADQRRLHRAVVTAQLPHFLYELHVVPTWRRDAVGAQRVLFGRLGRPLRVINVKNDVPFAHVKIPGDH